MLLGCVQDGGVVSMYDGAVTFNGGTITNTKAVRTGHDARWRSCTGCRMLRAVRWAVCGERRMGMRHSMFHSRL
jgi:hypothetical protein